MALVNTWARLFLSASRYVRVETDISILSNRKVAKVKGLYGYLLDSTTPNRWWFDQGREGGRFYLNGLLGQTVEQLAPGRRLAAVEPERKFVEVIVQVILANGTLVRTQQPTLQKRDDRVHSWQQMSALGLTALDEPIVKITLQTQVRRQAIGLHRAARFDHLSDEAMQTDLGQVRNTPETNPTDAFAVRLDRDHDQGFVLCLSASPSGFFGSPIGFVHLDQAPQPIPARPDHRPPEFVQHGPGGLVAAQAQDPLQSQGADAIFLTGDMPHGPKPSGQGQVRVLEDRARCHRGLVPTVATEPQATPHGPSLSSAARRADETSGPPERKQVRLAGGVGGKTLLQHLQSSRVVFHDPEHYKLW